MQVESIMYVKDYEDNVNMPLRISLWVYPVICILPDRTLDNPKVGGRIYEPDTFFLRTKDYNTANSGSNR